MKTIIVLVSLLCSLSMSAGEVKWTANVHVVVSASEDLKQKVESFISREIRGLHDVNIVDADEFANYEILVVALESQSKLGEALGYSLSVVVESNFNTNVWRIFPFFSEIDSKAREQILETTKNQSACVHHALYICGNDSLKTECETIVEEIDTHCFGPARKSLAHLNATMSNPQGTSAKPFSFADEAIKKDK